MVEDVTHLLDREDGTAFDENSLLFGSYEGSAAVHPDRVTVNDYNLMLDRYGKAATLERVLTLPIRSAPYSIQRGPATTQVADWVSEALMATANNGGMTTPMNTLIAQALGAIVHRKAYFEKVFTERDGKIVYDKVAWRPPSTCSIQRDTRTAAFEGFRQIPYRLDNTNEVYIPAHRALVYIHNQHRNPLEGHSDFNIAYWCYQTSLKIKFLWFSFLETQALPRTVVKHQDPVEAIKGAKKIQTLRQSGVVGLEKGYDVEALQSEGRGGAQFKEALQWLDSEASGSVLAGFTDLTSGATSGTGSFALSKDQTDFFLMSRQSTSRELADTLNQYLIPDLVRYNFGPNTPSPVFEFGPIAQDDMAQSIGLLQATASTHQSSAIPTEFFDELIERVAGFLELDTQVVRAGLDRAKKEAEKKATTEQEAQVLGTAGAVNAATNAVVTRIGETVDNPTSPDPIRGGSPLNRPPRQRNRPVDLR